MPVVGGGSPVPRRSTYSLTEQMIAVRVSGDPDPANNGLHHLYTNPLGSVSAIRQANGAVQQTRYLPFGGYRAGSGPNPITSHAYTSQQENMDIGLYYYNARYYAPTLARFLSADTIVPDPANPQSFNRYSYVENRPLNFNDPTGHCANEFFDIDCWDEYDALVNQFKANDYTEEQILDLIGTGENYVYKGMRIIDIFDRYRNCGSDFDCSNNSPRPYDPYEHPCDWQYWQKCYDPISDYSEIGANFFIGFKVLWDDWDNVYFNVHISWSPGGSIMAGNIKIQTDDGWQDIEAFSVEQQEQIVQEFLTGWGDGGCASLGVTACISGNRAGNYAVLGGVATPGLGTDVGYTALIYDHGNLRPWFWQRWFRP